MIEQIDRGGRKNLLEKAGKELTDKMMPIGAKLYEEAAKEAPAEGEEAKTAGEEPIEGEVVVDDKK